MCNNVTTFYDNNLLGGHPESPSTFYVVSVLSEHGVMSVRTSTPTEFERTIYSTLSRPC